MPVDVNEKWTSRGVKRGSEYGDDSISIEFVATGSDVTSEVEDAIVAWLPATTGALPLDDYEFEQIAPDVWEGSATYKAGGDDPAGGDDEPQESETSFDTSGATTNLTTSIARVAKKAKAGETAPGADVGDPGEINDGEDGPQGVDVTIPQFTFSERHIVPAAIVDGGYVVTLANLTGTVNDGFFRNFAAGEVLFLGASGSKQGIGGDYSIEYRFAASPNKQGIVIGELEAVDKKGWEFLWVRYSQVIDEDANPKRTTSTPVAVYVEQVYPITDFDQLNIG